MGIATHNVRRMAQEVVNALEAGERIEDHRGVVYRQQFGEAFLRTLKLELAEEKVTVEQTASAIWDFMEEFCRARDGRILNNDENVVLRRLAGIIREGKK